MTTQEIVSSVSKETGVSEAKIYNHLRTKKVWAARLEVYKRLRADGYSYPEIGEAMGRDHSTILRVIKRHEEKR